MRRGWFIIHPYHRRSRSIGNWNQGLIECVKYNPVQDWLERCPWGISTERYINEEIEQDQLKKAVS
jgi:hypothetical protein